MVVEEKREEGGIKEMMGLWLKKKKRRGNEANWKAMFRL